MLFEFKLAGKNVAKDFLYIWEILHVDTTKGFMETLFGLEIGGHSQAPRNVGPGTE